MILTTDEKLKILIKRQHMTLGDLADRLGYSRQNLHQRLKRKAWSEDDLRNLADKLGCDLEITFIDRATGERL